MAVHKCYAFRFKQKNLLSPTPDACCLLLALRSIQLMTGEPRTRYSTLQLLGQSGACGQHHTILSIVPADWLTQLGAMLSADTVMINFKSHIYRTNASGTFF